MNIKHPTTEQLPLLRQLWKEAFGDSDEFLDSFFRTAFSSNRCLCATIGCAVVAVAYWFSCGEYAYIYAVATAKEHQGQGICHALMVEIHTLLKAQGYHGSVLVPGDTGLREFYRGMGYLDFGGITEFECDPGAPLPIHSITAEEFALFRRKYLPADAIVQEAENLAFLSSFAKFYVGDHFLLAAVAEDRTLRVLELLGDPTAAAGILGALNMTHGIFRCPGKEKFGMWLPFHEKNPPTYFGFAFD